jgi:hypothetical protein
MEWHEKYSTIELIICVFFSFLPIAAAGEIKPEYGCKENPAIVGECFKIHGRISLYNGTPGVRIWPVGTKRLLGVLPSENEIMPPNVSKHIALGTDIFGDFVVCPFTKQEPGHMQFVCIESASNLVLERHGPGEASEIIVIKE